MTPESRRTLGNIILGIVIVLLIVAIAEMSGLIPKYVPSRELTLMAIVLSVVASRLRRQPK